MRIANLAAVALAGSIAVLVPSSPVLAGKTIGASPSTALALRSGTSDWLGADLAVSLGASAWDPEVSSTLVYTVTVTNVGKADGSWATVRSPLGDHVEWIAGDDDCRSIGDAVICDIAPLAGGESRQLQFELEVFEPYPLETIQEVKLTATDPDPTTTNNFAQIRTVLDVEAPVVEMVRARYGESGRRLRACTQLAAVPSRLEVTFSEAMKTGPTPRFVDAVSSYRLVRPGADGVFDELSCAQARATGFPSDDVDVKILAVAWDEENLTAELALDSISSVFDGSGHWRLIACGGLTDVVGNALDGDGDGEGGDDAKIDFRVDVGNLIDNGHFDCNVDHWISVGAEPEAFVLGADSERSALSHAGRIEGAAGTFTVGAGQCVVGPAPGAYQFSLRHRLSPSFGEPEFAPVAGAWVGVACTLYESSTCDGMTQLVGGDVSSSVPVPGDGTWGKLAENLEIPENTGSMLCTVAASSEGEALTFEFDGMRLAPVAVESSTFGGGSTSMNSVR
ncbi:MAG: hypothetical protein AMXMBFR36_26510 [Acidobacteriota bacterium]